MANPVGYYRFYNAGRTDGCDEDLYIFTCSREQDGPGACHSVTASHLAENVTALMAAGYLGPVVGVGA